MGWGNVLIGGQFGDPLSSLHSGRGHKGPYSIDEIRGFLDTADSAYPDGGSINQLGWGRESF